MLKNVPRPIGRLLSGVRAGIEKITALSQAFEAVPDAISVSSPAFEDGGAMAARFTADGEKLSPPLRWSGVPPGAASVVLIIEDPDAPSLTPLVHCIAWDLPGRDGNLTESELKSAGTGGNDHDLGLNSFLSARYLPPDPPTGHGAHRYVFQIFALDRRLELSGTPGRRAVREAMSGHVMAKGTLVATYERK